MWLVRLRDCSVQSLAKDCFPNAFYGDVFP